MTSIESVVRSVTASVGVVASVTSIESVVRSVTTSDGCCCICDVD